MTLKTLESIRSDSKFGKGFVWKLKILIFHNHVCHVVARFQEDLKMEKQKDHLQQLLKTTIGVSTLKHWISLLHALLIDLISLDLGFIEPNSKGSSRRGPQS